MQLPTDGRGVGGWGVEGVAGGGEVGVGVAGVEGGLKGREANPKG